MNGAAVLLWLLVGICIGAVAAFYVLVILPAKKPQKQEQVRIDTYA